ncbi:hypothetical protein [Methylomicrobium lacus]|uniref:hypothetical protein n=1 Tax=Methylomicrobium lacus TaxID=136992 RepID=UPI0035A82CD9
MTLLKADLIFTSLTKGNAGIFSILSICFVAGFSETLIPNTLKKIEDQENKGTNKTN